MVEYLNPPYKVTTKQLWWQKQGLQQTATGYGRKLNTGYMLETPDGRKRRVYAICYSNVVSFYVKVRGKLLFLRDGELQTARDTGSVT
jgi:hypothetical protein